MPTLSHLCFGIAWSVITSEHLMKPMKTMKFETWDVSILVCFAGDGCGGDHLESDSADPDVQVRTYVDVPVRGPTPAGNWFHMIWLLFVNNSNDDAFCQ